MLLKHCDVCGHIVKEPQQEKRTELIATIKELEMIDVLPVYEKLLALEADLCEKCSTELKELLKHYIDYRNNHLVTL